MFVQPACDDVVLLEHALHSLHPTLLRRRWEILTIGLRSLCLNDFLCRDDCNNFCQIFLELLQERFVLCDRIQITCFFVRVDSLACQDAGRCPVALDDSAGMFYDS